MVVYDFVFSIGDNLGYPGILLIAFLISLLVFVPIPYIPILILALSSSRLDPSLNALSSVIGVTLDRSVIFLASYRGRALIDKTTLKRMIPFTEVVDKVWLIGIICCCCYTDSSRGIAKFNLFKFILTIFGGKLLITVIENPDSLKGTSARNSRDGLGGKGGTTGRAAADINRGRREDFGNSTFTK